MIRSTLVLAAGCLGLQAPALSQSTVSLFGTVDLNVTFAKSGSRSVSAMDQGGNVLPSRLGFRGTEDLGGGLAASFWLEARDAARHRRVPGALGCAAPLHR
jgi:predicted porin